LTQPGEKKFAQIHATATMDPNAFAMNTVPVRPAAAAAAGSTTALLSGAVIVLAAVVIYVVWRRARRAKPACAGYKGITSMACQAMSETCGTNGPCLNAVAHCLPVMDSLTKAASGGPAAIAAALSGRDLRACTNAITEIDPKFAAGVAMAHGGSKACLPPQAAPILGNPTTFGALYNTLDAVAPLTPYALKVARELPTCSDASNPMNRINMGGFSKLQQRRDEQMRREEPK
jgi:hypothetical protein